MNVFSRSSSDIGLVNCLTAIGASASAEAPFFYRYLNYIFMKPLEISNTDAQNYLNKDEIANETLIQLKKDFGSYGDQLPENINPEQGYEFLN